MKFSMRLVMVALCALTAGMVVAADPQPGTEQPQMPPMGPPEEMKSLGHLVGTWDVASKFNMSMDSAKEAWQDSKATATFSYIVEGAVMQCTYQSEEMGPGMPAFSGVMLQAYDREAKQWQAIWVDNMSGRMTMYTGARAGDQVVLQGEGVWLGQKFLSRITTFNETPTTYEWKMEDSFDGGKTWKVSGTATYTKRA